MYVEHPAETELRQLKEHLAHLEVVERLKLSTGSHWTDWLTDSISLGICVLVGSVVLFCVFMVGYDVGHGHGMRVQQHKMELGVLSQRAR
jgi:hypothetical protein